MIITIGDWSDHLNNIELVMKNLRANRLKCNIKRLFSGQTDMEFPGLWVTRTGIQPVNTRINHPFINMKLPINLK